MTTKADIIHAIQAAADATGVNTIRMGLGAPGARVEDPAGDLRETGAGWVPEPKTWSVVAAGLAAWYDAQGIPAMKGKLNELIGAYNQLRADYNSGTVPTTAPAVVPLP